MRPLLFVALLLLAPGLLSAEDDFLRGSVVKSDKWTLDRAKDLEIFDGDVSFNNPLYSLKADNAVYRRKDQAWDMRGNVYMLRRFTDGSQVQVDCHRAHYLEQQEAATLLRGQLPVRMKYTGPDGRVLRGRSDSAVAQNKKGLMTFDGSFSLSTDNLDMYSQKGLYDNSDATFLMYDSTPLAVGTREGYDFAINAEEIKFFRDSRDIKFYNRVKGWVKDPGDGSAEKAAKRGARNEGPASGAQDI